MESTTPLLLLFLLFLQPATSADGCYSSIFSFGDSLADTGNLLDSLNGNHRSGHPPYGMTFFHHPTGRFSDGRLIVDFIAEAMELPLLPPYLEAIRSTAAEGGGGELRQGVNFAVARATAMEYEFFKERGIRVRDNNGSSLSIQLQWFKQLLPSLCSSPSDCKNMLQNSLFLVGEIGGNDYNNPLRQGIPLIQIESFVPLVMQTVSSAINELIEMGAHTLVVPGITPLGCNPVYLTLYHNSTSAVKYDHMGCIKWLNQFCSYHNNLLQDEVRQLRKLHHHATLIYADYYGAIMDIFENPDRFGFDHKELFVTCCGGGGPFNFNFSAQCGGDKRWTVCKDPSKFVHWDGLHCTEAAYRVIAESLLKGPFATPTILNSCPDIRLNIDDSSRSSQSSL